MIFFELNKNSGKGDGSIEVTPIKSSNAMSSGFSGRGRKVNTVEVKANNGNTSTILCTKWFPLQGHIGEYEWYVGPDINNITVLKSLTNNSYTYRGDKCIFGTYALTNTLNYKWLPNQKAYMKLVFKDKTSGWVQPDGSLGDTPVLVGNWGGDATRMKLAIDYGTEGLYEVQIYFEYSATDSINELNIIDVKAISTENNQPEYISITNQNIKLIFDRTITYGDIVIDEFSFPDVPANGSKTLPTVKYHQTYGYMGNTTGGGVINSGADLLFSRDSGNFTIITDTGAITSASKGKVESGRTNIGVAKVEVLLNGKSKIATVPIYQEANIKEFIDNVAAEPIVYLSTESYTFPAKAVYAVFNTYYTQEVISNYRYTSGEVSQESETNKGTVEANLTGDIFSIYKIEKEFAIGVAVEKNTTNERRRGELEVYVRYNNTIISKTAELIQEAADEVVGYGNITIVGSIEDIPAKGGMTNIDNITATQSVRYSNGDLRNIDVSEYITVSPSTPLIEGENLQGTIKPRTELGIITINVKANGKKATKDFTVYQQENRVEKTVRKPSRWNLSDLRYNGGTSKVVLPYIARDPVTITGLPKRTVTTTTTYTSEYVDVSEETETTTMFTVGSNADTQPMIHNIEKKSDGTVIVTFVSNVELTNNTLTTDSPTYHTESEGVYNSIGELRNIPFTSKALLSNTRNRDYQLWYIIDGVNYNLAIITHLGYTEDRKYVAPPVKVKQITDFNLTRLDVNLVFPDVNDYPLSPKIIMVGDASQWLIKDGATSEEGRYTVTIEISQDPKWLGNAKPADPIRMNIIWNKNLLYYVGVNPENNPYEVTSKGMNNLISFNVKTNHPLVLKLDENAPYISWESGSRELIVFNYNNYFDNYGESIIFKVDENPKDGTNRKFYVELLIPEINYPSGEIGSMRSEAKTWFIQKPLSGSQPEPEPEPEPSYDTPQDTPEGVFLMDTDGKWYEAKSPTHSYGEGGILISYNGHKWFMNPTLYQGGNLGYYGRNINPGVPIADAREAEKDYGGYSRTMEARHNIAGSPDSGFTVWETSQVIGEDIYVPSTGELYMLHIYSEDINTALAKMGESWTIETLPYPILSACYSAPNVCIGYKPVVNQYVFDLDAGPNGVGSYVVLYAGVVSGYETYR